MLGRSVIDHTYIQRCTESSDINEHLPTLARYASQCSHITECGVRSVTSSYAFALALIGKPNNKLIQIDLDNHDNIGRFQSLCKREGIHTIFHNESDLTCPLENTELLFIDTWHAYKQLIAELRLHQANVAKYIILHDTTSYANHDESSYAALGEDWQPQGIGLWKAVEDFIEEFPKWQIKHRYTHNNGLTILQRK
jgi:cephalosporin hydroxylase